LLRFDASKLAGLCLARGGRTSHVAILAAEMGVPMLVAVGEQALAIPDDVDAILDADGGEISISPGTATLDRAQSAIATRAERRAAAKARAHEDCRMADGTRIEIAANLASVEDARRAAENGAEACGLLRTEFLFMDRAAPPDESEQTRAYQDIAS